MCLSSWKADCDRYSTRKKAFQKAWLSEFLYKRNIESILLLSALELFTRSLLFVSIYF